MPLWGTWVNVIMILVGSIGGLVLRRGIPDLLQQTLMQGIGLVLVVLGLSMALSFSDPLVLLCCVVLGTAVGEVCGIVERLDALTTSLSQRFGGGEGWPKAFITSTMVFCIGSMAIMGAMQSGLEGCHDILLTKSTLDFFTSLLFAAGMGIGVALSVVPVFLYQGLLTLGAGILNQWLSPEMIAEMNCVGGVLLLGLGFNLVGATQLRINAMLPALFMPILVIAVTQVI